ncbi:transcription repressor NadR [Anaeroselena agilis]|uniref:Transcription repressor NadR n=1 Tax=Anaeroselena agilis TaxID=3063788 RepID=A0ABU3P038_9FIRM|nr:transcription repressor NadR [Selenomonadales bacterium 4137-cl]
MDARERRNRLIDKLHKTGEPVTGTALAQELGVSRQVIVGDIAILRAAGAEIYATPQGYLLPAAKPPAAATAKIACQHGWDKLADELAIIIDNGGKVLDVIVEHPVYGELKANLMLASRHDLTDFLRSLKNSGAEPLSAITGGVHLHTVEAPSPEVLARIERELERENILYK